jgi:hypothetical protein
MSLSWLGNPPPDVAGAFIPAVANAPPCAAAPAAAAAACARHAPPPPHPATCAGQGGQDRCGVQAEHQSWEHPGNAGLLRCQRQGAPVRLWALVAEPDPGKRLLRTTGYALSYQGLFQACWRWGEAGLGRQHMGRSAGGGEGMLVNGCGGGGGGACPMLPPAPCVKGGGTPPARQAATPARLALRTRCRWRAAGAAPRRTACGAAASACVAWGARGRCRGMTAASRSSCRRAGIGGATGTCWR